ncbi:molybdopterin-guanine dinucleotide biosynthesis protein B [uncultured Tissierella sp.]|jgi:molybdopterin-guanine dinucleotide biosynthesis protein B|uniref:molybdopterin-guanine dinucleotide biosynthesis protein B n=1 Tax=uncultured Tissierella sp. TaxID=448160 RepID=UPI002804BCEE|nr:molybdopterin-guanine dinucleotide biosynthesis protein B [uncultured Tissierella sp.]MDU5081782.1 molybdopterin-guanine dinucleotide biosynthesis protein B [Bacillota bacterium]
MIPVFSIIGSKSNTGKTMILCKIIKELKNRGYRVATIKHHMGDFEIDHPEKDTWKHSQAGSDIVVISSPVKIAKIEKVREEYKLDDIISKIENVDIIITEGYKKENKPKLEVIRKEISLSLISKESELFGIVTDFPLENQIPQFNFEQVKEIVNLIEEKFLKE